MRLGRSASWLLRQDAAETGPPVMRRAHGGTARRRAQTMCARSPNVHGRASSEPRSALADSEGRMPGERVTGGVFLWLSFFAQALRRRSGANSGAGRVAAKGRMPGVKKVTRSPEASGSSALQRTKTKIGLRAAMTAKNRGAGFPACAGTKISNQRSNWRKPDARFVLRKHHATTPVAGRLCYGAAVALSIAVMTKSETRP